MCKNYVLIKIRVCILPKLSIFRITIFLYIGAFPIGIQRVIPFTKGTAHPLQLDLQISILKQRTKDSLGGLGELGEITLAVSIK